MRWVECDNWKGIRDVSKVDGGAFLRHHKDLAGLIKPMADLLM